MSLTYDSYAYLWPARPENAIPTGLLSFYENKKWVAQYKKNGTCSVIFVTPDKEVIPMTRHDAKHKAWSPTPESNAAFKALPGKGWYVFTTELLHSKVSGIRDTHYVFDMMVCDGEYLVGFTLEERLAKLYDLFGCADAEEDYSHYIINPHIWVAKLVRSDFYTLWKDVNVKANATDKAYVDEGLVLKNPNAKLILCNKANANSQAMVKCRVEHKNYGF